MANTVSSFSVGISADVSEMVSGFNQAAMSSQQLVSGMNSVGQSMGAIGGGQASSGLGELSRVMEMLALRTEATSRAVSRLANNNERLLAKISAARQATRGQTDSINEQKTAVDQLASAKRALFDAINNTAALDTAYIDESSEMATLERLQIKMRQMKDQQKGESILGDLQQAEADIERLKSKMGSSADAAIGGGSGSKKVQDQLNEAVNRRAVAMQKLKELQDKQNASANEMTVLQQKIGDEEYRIGQLRAKSKEDEAVRKRKEEQTVLEKIKEQTAEREELELKIMEMMNPAKAQQERMQREKESHLKKVKKLLDDQVRSGQISQSYANHLLHMEDQRITKTQQVAKQQEQALKAQRKMGYAAQQFGFLLDDIVAGSGTRGVAGAIQASANNITSMLASMRASAKVVFGASIMIALLQISAQTGLLNKALEKLGMTAGDAVKELKELPKIHEQIADAQKAHVQHLREMQRLRLDIDVDGAASSIASLNDKLTKAVIDAQKAGADAQVERLEKNLARNSGSVASFAKAFFGGGGQDAALSDRLARNKMELAGQTLLMRLTGGILGDEEARNHTIARRGELLKEERRQQEEVKRLTDDRSEKVIAHEKAQQAVNRALELQAMAVQKVLHLRRELEGQVADRIADKKAEVQSMQNLLNMGRDEITTAQKRKQIEQERSRLLFDMREGQKDVDRALQRQAVNQRAILAAEKELKASIANNSSIEERIKLGQKLAALNEEDARLQKGVLEATSKFESAGDKLLKNRKALIELQKQSNQNAQASRSTLLGMMGAMNEKLAEQLQKTERRAEFERQIKEMREAGFVDSKDADQQMKTFDRVERMEARRNALLEKQKKLKKEIKELSSVSIQDAIDARSAEGGKVMKQSIIDAMTAKDKDPQVKELEKVNQQLKELEAAVKEIPTLNLQTS